MIPVYVVTGLLGSGKTSLINVALRERKKLGSTEIISF
ncbi:MAG: GTP-binding protein, partial [Veillonella sp.]